MHLQGDDPGLPAADHVTDGPLLRPHAAPLHGHHAHTHSSLPGSLQQPFLFKIVPSLF